MRGGLRQSMAWVHTWTGLVLGWLLFFMFLTGTAGYFDTEIDRWMRPELPLRSAELSTAEAVDIALRRLRTEAPGAVQWIVYPPSGRDVAEINVSWQNASGAAGRPSRGSEVLDRETGEPIAARDTGGGQVLYQMHYQLRYLPSSAAYWIVGIATMLMLIAILSGVITHKRIFRDFFTFRPDRERRAWLDAHNVLGVLALPFHLMITYSGLVFFMFTYMPLIVAAGYGANGQQQFFDEAFPRAGVTARAESPAPLAPLGPMIAAAESRWGAGQIRSIDIRDPGDANARVVMTRSHVTPTSNGDRLVFDGASGALLAAPTRSAPMAVNETMMSLHEGLFSGSLLRWLYFLSGLLGTALIATGLVYWTAKRRAKASGHPHRGLWLVERLNIGVIAGLPVAIGAYFWANRLLPVDFAARAEWEVHALFIVWAAMLVHAMLRRPARAWVEQLAAACGVLCFLPILNAWTTDRHLGVSLPQGAWDWAGVDLTLLGLGAMLGMAAYRLRRRTALAPQRYTKQASSSGRPSSRALSTSIGTETA